MAGLIIPTLRAPLYERCLVRDVISGYGRPLYHVSGRHLYVDQSREIAQWKNERTFEVPLLNSLSPQQWEELFVRMLLDGLNVQPGHKILDQTIENFQRAGVATSVAVFLDHKDHPLIPEGMMIAVPEPSHLGSWIVKGDRRGMLIKSVSGVFGYQVVEEPPQQTRFERILGVDE